MADLLTASGRADMLKQLRPALQRIESTLAEQGKPLMRALGNVDRPTWLKIGGGAAAFAALFLTAQQLLKKPAPAPKKTVAANGRRTRTATRAKPAAKRARAKSS